MMFPIASSIEDIVAALEEYRGVFIKDAALFIQGKTVYNTSRKVFEEGNLPSLDEKTMFPTSIKSLPNVERKVIQQYVEREWSVSDSNLMESMDEVIENCVSITQDIFYHTYTKYNFPYLTLCDILFREEWTLNVAQYPFIPGNEGAVLFPAHKDWGLLAIYPYVNGAGLEVYTGPTDKWQPVEIPEGCVFCYAGDIFSKITNGAIEPLLHRVIQPADQVGSRTSIIFYADPIRSMILPNGNKVGDIIDAKLRKIEQIK